MPRCKNCKEKFEPIRFNHKYCLSDNCIKAFVAEVKEKTWKETKTQMKTNLKTTQDWLKEAQIIFNCLIRLRDEGQLCISCNTIPKKKNAGHYYSQGGHSNVRFDEDNVHLQCEHCNTYLSGNLLNYQIGIEKRIGAAKLIELQGRAHIEKKWTIEELKNIIKKYKEKVKAIK
jgi:hypothetical protein